MANLILQDGRVITDTYGNCVFQTRKEAEMALIEATNCKEEHVLDRIDKIDACIDDGDIIILELPCVVCDTGSVDWFYFID